MTVTLSTNLIADDAAVQVNGAQNVVSWYGGHCNIAVSGTFGGANLQVQVCTKIPATNGVPDLSSLVDADWANLSSAFSASGNFSDFLNPCLIRGFIASASGSTQIRAIVR